MREHSLAILSGTSVPRMAHWLRRLEHSADALTEAIREIASRYERGSDGDPEHR